MSSERTPDLQSSGPSEKVILIKGNDDPMQIHFNHKECC